MKTVNSNIFSAVAFLLALATVKAQEVQVTCTFRTFIGQYMCELNNITIPDVPNAVFIIGGIHTLGRNNANVQRVLILNSNIPFVISQLFTTFPNVNTVTIQNTGLTRIQSNAFLNGSNIERVEISFNQNLRSIEANAFLGLARAISLDLTSNSIETLHENAFNGLNSLEFLTVNRNLISQLPSVIFAPLRSLQTLYFENNQMVSLDGGLFAGNPELSIATFSRNQINEIGRNFLDSLKQLRYLELFENVCVRSSWYVEIPEKIEVIRADLEPCFANSDPPSDELRRIVLEVRGPFTLKFENGTHIVTV
jgi:Leucine-rich repeat (LRR) protein